MAREKIGVLETLLKVGYESCSVVISVRLLIGDLTPENYFWKLSPY
jgi:hypothetical protein